MVMRLTPGGEGAVPEHAQVDHGVLGAQLAHDHRNKAEDAERREDADLHAAKPAFVLSGVKNDLQQAETEGKESDAAQIDAAGAVLVDIRRVVHEGADH
jgi:hypothetical protein